MPSPYLRLMRPGDWVKNVFILPALVFSQRLDEPALVARSGAAFVAFSLLASGFYSINDALDAPRDREHPIKRHRPVASGRVSPRRAVLFGLGCLAAGWGAGFAVNAALGLTLGFYVLLQVLYNARLKRVMFVDVVVVALGFGLRAAAGAVAIDIQLSIWLLLCVFFLCLYLGFIKRLSDLASARAAGNGRWHSPAGYEDRAELNWLLGFSGVLAVMTYLMYALSEHAASIFGARAMGFAIMSPLVLVAVHRFFRRASLGVSDSPMAALRQDRAVLASVLLFAAGTVLTLYVPAVEAMLRAVFYVSHEGPAQ